MRNKLFIILSIIVVAACGLSSKEAVLAQTRPQIKAITVDDKNKRDILDSCCIRGTNKEFSRDIIEITPVLNDTIGVYDKDYITIKVNDDLMLKNVNDSKDFNRISALEGVNKVKLCYYNYDNASKEGAKPDFEIEVPVEKISKGADQERRMFNWAVTRGDVETIYHVKIFDESGNFRGDFTHSIFAQTKPEKKLIAKG